MSCADFIFEEINIAKDAIKATNASNFNAITFEWENVKYTSSYQQKDTGKHIHLRAQNIGCLFFTIENSGMRTESLKQISKCNRNFDGRFTLHKDNSVSYEVMTKIEENLSGQDLIKATTTIMLDIGPVVRMLKSYLKQSNHTAKK